jgi:hypothetical protein
MEHNDISTRHPPGIKFTSITLGMITILIKLCHVSVQLIILLAYLNHDGNVDDIHAWYRTVPCLVGFISTKLPVCAPMGRAYRLTITISIL